MATTSATRLDRDEDRVYSVELVAESVSRDRLLDLAGADDDDGEMQVDEEPLPLPRKGAPKTMRELAELFAQQQAEGGGGGTPPVPGENGGDLVIEGTSRETPGRRTTRRRTGTRTKRTAKKRTRRRGDSGDDSDDDGDEHEHEEGEEGTPAKRLHVAPMSPASTPNPNSGSGRVLRPRPQKSVR